MATGLFRSPTSQSVGAGAHQRGKRKSGPPLDRAQLGRFAEALAETGTVAAASRTIGVCHQRGSQYLARIKAELGWQAQ